MPSVLFYDAFLSFLQARVRDLRGNPRACGYTVGASVRDGGGSIVEAEGMGRERLRGERESAMRCSHHDGGRVER